MECEIEKFLKEFKLVSSTEGMNNIKEFKEKILKAIRKRVKKIRESKEVEITEISESRVKTKDPKWGYPCLKITVQGIPFRIYLPSNISDIVCDLNPIISKEIFRIAKIEEEYRYCKNCKRLLRYEEALFSWLIKESLSCCDCTVLNKN